MTKPSTRDRAIGALLGLAVGDALGTTLEFTSPANLTPLTDMIGGGPFSLEPGQWTDDTSMALCLGESLLERRTFDAHDQMTRFLRWFRHGHWSSTGRCFDIGNIVRNALEAFERGDAPPWGPTDEQSAGNGSLMRLAPVPIYWHRETAHAIARAADSSRTTHGTATAVDACRFASGLIVGAMTGATKEELLAPRYTPVTGAWDDAPLHPLIDAVASGAYARKTPPEIRGDGYVVRSLEAALWAFATTTDFRTGALAAVNLGEDADTTGVVYGQLAGAYYGVEGTPQEWRERVTRAGDIAEMAERLVSGAAGET